MINRLTRFILGKLPTRWAAGDPAIYGPECAHHAQSVVVLSSARSSITGLERVVVRSTTDHRVFSAGGWDLQRPGAERARRRRLGVLLTFDVFTLAVIVHSGRTDPSSMVLAGVVLASMLMTMCSWPPAVNDLVWHGDVAETGSVAAGER